MGKSLIVLIDGRRQAGSVPSDFDVCVVGSGPAGLTLAMRLAERGHRVGVIEGGGRGATVRNQRLLVDQLTGSPYWKLQNVRVRVLGGSGTRWGGIARGLDELDFAHRPWVEASSWPIDRADVSDYYEQAARVLQLDDPGPDPSADDLRAADFELAQYRRSPLTDFAAVHERRVRDDPNLVVLLNTNVVALVKAPGGDRIASVTTRTFSGTTREITARHFVLATGGVENARLLLASDVGNEHGMVGRCFMEHVHVPIAEITPEGPLREWLSYDLEDWPQLRRTFVPTARVQQEHELLNASMAIGPSWYVGEPPFVRWDYRLRQAYDRVRGTGALEWVAGRVPHPFHGLKNRDVPSEGPESNRLVVYRGEQPPRADNQVVLSSKTDEFGQPRAHLHWTQAEPELGNVEKVTELFRKTVQVSGWGRLGAIKPDWRANTMGGPHHMGTTRMSADPATGVVDRDCRVHSVANLHVAGSSVFATGGHANPTFTIVALSLRLADHLSAGMR